MDRSQLRRVMFRVINDIAAMDEAYDYPHMGSSWASLSSLAQDMYMAEEINWAGLLTSPNATIRYFAEEVRKGLREENSTVVPGIKTP